MGSTGTVSMAEVWAMLDQCAPGYTKKQKPHHWHVSLGAKTYPSLPLGAHGKRTNAEVQVGHVKKMARFLGVLDCALVQLGLR